MWTITKGEKLAPCLFLISKSNGAGRTTFGCNFALEAVEDATRMLDRVEAMVAFEHMGKKVVREFICQTS